MMSDLRISDDLLNLLSHVAKQENRPVDEVVESALRRYATAHSFP